MTAQDQAVLSGERVAELRRCAENGRLVQPRSVLALLDALAAAERRAEEAERAPITVPDGLARDFVALEKRNADLVEGLKPFADAAEGGDDERHDDCHTWESPMALGVSYGDFRRARALVAAPDAPTPMKDDER